MAEKRPLVVGSNGEPVEISLSDNLPRDLLHISLELIANEWEGGGFAVTGDPDNMRTFVAYDDNSEAVGIHASMFGVSLLDDVDAAAARATLGLGTAATKNTGTSGDTVPKNDTANTWSATQTLTNGQLRTAEGTAFGFGAGTRNKFRVTNLADPNGVEFAITDSGEAAYRPLSFAASSILFTEADTSATIGLSGAVFTVAAAAEANTSVLSPAQITANTDNYAPTGHAAARYFRLSTDASRNLTGLAGGTSGRRITISNVGAQNLVLSHDVTSTAANRFLCPGSAAFTLNANDSVDCWYDATSARWRVVAF